MTPMDAWRIISANLAELYKRRRTEMFKGYTKEETEAEVICFMALKLLEERGGESGEHREDKKNVS